MPNLLTVLWDVPKKWGALYRSEEEDQHLFAIYLNLMIVCPLIIQTAYYKY